MIMSCAADQCVAAVLEAVTASVRAVVKGHENATWSIGAALLETVSAPAIASHFDVSCEKHRKEGDLNGRLGFVCVS
jgi:hypothetical protein